MINSRLTVPVYMRNNAMSWVPSPSKKVLRKRFFLRGPKEAGQVTSLVKYLPGSEFPNHPHPDGEEILVLDGVFSDHTGDWPAGSWLLHPEGFSHAPGSNPGCLLFVRLRQYKGRERLAVSLAGLGWVGARDSELLATPEGNIRIMTLAPGERRVMQGNAGLEGFVVNGQVRVQGWPLVKYDWFRLPPVGQIVIESSGCVLYVDEGSVSRLADTAARPIA